MRFEQMCRGFAVSPTNGLFKTIFQVKHYWLNNICLSENLNECVEASLYALYKTIFQVSLLNQLNKLCLPKDLKEHAEASLCHQQAPFQDHLLSKTLLPQWTLSPGRPKQICWGFLVHPLQNHLLIPGKPILLTQWALSYGRSERICRGFTVSTMNGLFKTIF